MKLNFLIYQTYTIAKTNYFQYIFTSYILNTTNQQSKYIINYVNTFFFDANTSFKFKFIGKWDCAKYEIPNVSIYIYAHCASNNKTLKAEEKALSILGQHTIFIYPTYFKWLITVYQYIPLYVLLLYIASPTCCWISSTLTQESREFCDWHNVW